MNGQVWLAVTVPFAAAAAMQMMNHSMMNNGMMAGSMARHHQAMMAGVPEPYRKLRNPLPNSLATLRRGALVYEQTCASCHGTNGYGNGPVGQKLRPRPANLAMIAHMPMGRSDGYLYWAVAEGGQRFGTAMPSFKRSLPRSDIWAVITYIRRGLPARLR